MQITLTTFLREADFIKCSFIAAVFCMHCGMSGAALANGKLTHLSGVVKVKQAGANDALALPDMVVKAGDVITTGANGYVRLQTSDGGNMVLRPNSELHFEQYNYEESQPEQDSFVYSLLKGGLRTVTGLVGKRGNKAAYLGKTTTATIGIRGTFFEMRVCNNDCGVLPNGSYFSLRSGAIEVGNATDKITINTGQVAFVPLDGAPQILPRDPGIGFTAPSDIPKQSEHKSDAARNEAAGGDSQDDASCAIQ